MTSRRNPGSYKHSRLLKKWLNAACEKLVVGFLVGFFFIAYGVLPNRWYHTLYVYSGSMSPTIEAGDVIIITPPPATLEPGMIVTLKVDNSLVTHRMLELRADGKIITKGDTNIDADEWGNAKVSVVGIYRARVPYLGYILAAVQNFFPVHASGAWFVDREMLELKLHLAPAKLVVTPTNTAGLTPTPTATPKPGSATPRATRAIESTGTPTGVIPTRTPTPTASPTLLSTTPDPEGSPTASAIPTFEPTMTLLVPTGTPIEPTLTLEPTWTFVPTLTLEPTWTLVPSSTPSLEPTASETAAPPPSPTLTYTPTPTAEPTFTDQPAQPTEAEREPIATLPTEAPAQ